MKISILFSLFAAGLFALVSTNAALAGEVQLACPADLTDAEQLGSCPSTQELKEGYDATCPSVMAKRNECKPYATYAKSKSKALWGVTSGGEEFLSYVRCSLPPETVKASKPQSVKVKCDMGSGRCEAQCGYENDFVLKLRFKGECKTANAGTIDCKDDPKACVVTCETF